MINVPLISTELREKDFSISSDSFETTEEHEIFGLLLFFSESVCALDNSADASVLWSGDQSRGRLMGSVRDDWRTLQSLR